MRTDLHYTLTVVDGLDAAVGATLACEVRPRFNIAPGQHGFVALAGAGGRSIEAMRWGLLPRWRGHGGKRGPLIHAAPVDAVAGTPLLRDSFKKQRCLVLADGCFAWRELKQPIWFHPEPRAPVAFAGVWSESDDDGQPSFAILTGPPLVTRVNHAMPIVLSAESYAEWLDPALPAERATALLVGCPLDRWRADLVSTRMSSAAHDDPRCIEPIGNPRQGELFG